MPRLNREQQTVLEALDSDAAYLAHRALRARDTPGLIAALQAWTAWDDRVVCRRLIDRPTWPHIEQAIEAGLHDRVGQQLRSGALETYWLLLRLYHCTQDEDQPPDPRDESRVRRLRVCDRCFLVTEGARRAARCTDCQKHHHQWGSEPPPPRGARTCPLRDLITGCPGRCDATGGHIAADGLINPATRAAWDRELAADAPAPLQCTVCGERPVTGDKRRCARCDADRVREAKRLQAQRRRARHRDGAGDPPST